MSPLNKADGYQALIRLTQALAKSEGEDADLIVDGLIELADRTEAYLVRYDPPETAALKCANAQAASPSPNCGHTSESAETAAPAARADRPADFEPPPAVPQRAADSGAHALEPGMRAAPSLARSP